MKRMLGLFLAVFLNAFALPVLAQQQPVPLTPQPSESAAQKRWYGWQTLLSDAVSIGLTMSGAAVSDGGHTHDNGDRTGGVALMAIGVAGYAAGAPILHFTNQRPLNGVGSIGLRLGLPALGGVIGALSASCRPNTDFCEYDQAGIGIGVGALAAIALDATLLAWAPVKAEARAGTDVQLVPVIAKDGKSGELRVSGRF